MSAWIASDKHIASVAMFIDKENTQDIANMLKRENILSVNWRYNEDTPIDPCDISEAIELNNADALSLMASLDYQSCEHPDWETTKAYWLLKNARAALRKGTNLFNKDGSYKGKWTI